MPPTHAFPDGSTGAPRVGRRSAWPVVLAALCLSLPLHLWLAVWLAGITVQRPERAQPAVLVEGAQGVDDVRPPGESASAESARQPEPSMPQPAPSEVADAAWHAASVAQGAIVPTAARSADDLLRDPGASGAPGSGAVSGGGSGGVGSTTFFGARATGRRFIFIVDKSGSMASNEKMRQAKDEMMRSVRALPDFTQFRVCLFDTGTRVFPEAGYARARGGDLDRLGGWLGRLAAHGGTTPVEAFRTMLADGAPDAIFFLTDGEIGAGDPSAIVQAVTRPSGVVPVHCVAFGDRSAATQLQGIAKATGGDFRFVPLGGTP